MTTCHRYFGVESSLENNILKDVVPSIATNTGGPHITILPMERMDKVGGKCFIELPDLGMLRLPSLGSTLACA